MGRPSIGEDINPVAVLMTKAKKTPIDPNKVEEQFLKLKNKINSLNKNTKVKTPKQ